MAKYRLSLEQRQPVTQNDSDCYIPTLAVDVNSNTCRPAYTYTTQANEPKYQTLRQSLDLENGTRQHPRWLGMELGENTTDVNTKETGVLGDNTHLIRGALRAMGDKIDETQVSCKFSKRTRIDLEPASENKLQQAELQHWQLQQLRNTIRSAFDDFGDGFGEAAFRGKVAAKHSPTSFDKLSKYSKAVSETVSNRNLSKSSPDSNRKRDILHLKSWRDGCSSQNPPSSEQKATREIHRLLEAAPQHVQQVAAAIQERQAHVLELLGPGTLKPFRPSHTVLHKFGLLPNLDVLRANVASCQYGCHNNYLGDITIPNNRSAEIPANQNCSLWILGLPANITHTILLGAIREVGKIYATVINPPVGPHSTAAAKIVFFERAQAEQMFSLIFLGHFSVMGQRIQDVRWNNIKSAPYSQLDHSRCIRITGSPHLMDFEFFEIFFKSRFTYELDNRAQVQCYSPDMVSHEWHFGSLRCQAASAKTAIEREFQGIFTVQWAHDPCASP